MSNEEVKNLTAEQRPAAYQRLAEEWLGKKRELARLEVQRSNLTRECQFLQDKLESLERAACRDLAEFPLLVEPGIEIMEEEPGAPWI